MPSEPTIHERKKICRRELRQRLSGLDAETRHAASQAICNHLRDSPLWRGARDIAVFHPCADEPEIRPLLSEAWAEGKTLLFPRVRGEALDFFNVRRWEELVPGPWNLLEPGPQSIGVDPASLDLILVP
ncbi:MAG: 5-formyltetrahydrofolate cyclo-ligase, partial [Blastochloris sp.]|nr:5-formyltetrahydrofolate cyclo-ligase [Blastochloris sp.]